MIAHRISGLFAATRAWLSCLLAYASHLETINARAPLFRRNALCYTFFPLHRHTGLVETLTQTICLDPHLNSTSVYFVRKLGMFDRVTRPDSNGCNFTNIVRKVRVTMAAEVPPEFQAGDPPICFKERNGAEMVREDTRRNRG